LHTRECLLRLSSEGQILPCIKAKTVDIMPVAAVNKDVKLKQYDAPQQLPSKFIEQARKAHTEAVEAGEAPPGPFSVVDLLAQHSQSRKTVNKKKGQS